MVANLPADGDAAALEALARTDVLHVDPLFLDLAGTSPLAWDTHLDPASALVA